MNQQSEMKINAMARKSFPSLHTFSIARRRKSGASGSDKASSQDDVQKRKVSVDHTVLLGDDSRHTPSQDFSRSFDVDSPPPSAFNRSSDPTLQARIDAIRIQQKLLGENHPDVIFSLSSLAKLQQKRGNHTEAAAILRESQTRTRLAQSTPQSSFGGYCVQSPPKVEHSDVPTEITVSHQG